VEVVERKTFAYHMLLSRVALKLISEEQMRVDYETGIKRYFYDHPADKLAYTDFVAFLEANFNKPPNLTHLIEIIYQEPGTEKTTVIPFNYENIQGISQTGKSRHCSVRVKDNVELSHITLNKKSEKSEKNEKNEKKGNGNQKED
jgi:hypothetical protein